MVGLLACLVALLCIAVAVLVCVVRRKKSREMADNQAQMAYHNQQY